MVDKVSSVVVQETVNQILSGVIDKYEYISNAKMNMEMNMERLDMAHIKLEAALETSQKWKINDKSMLRWRKKLKRAAQECDDTLRKCKQRILKEEEMEQEVKNYSFPKRIAHTTKSFVSSFLSGSTSSDYESSRRAVRRFECFADCASDFLRFLELGGTPRQHMFLDPLVRHLLAGKATVCKFARGNQHNLFFIRPFRTADHGIEGWLLFIHKDSDAPENDFILGLTLQLSESTDLVGIAVKCLELFYTPHFKSRAESVKIKLTQLPTHDLYWVPYFDSSHKRHWDNIHGVCTQWFRPNPLCCKQPCGSSNTNVPSELLSCTSISMEPVIMVYLQAYIPLPARCNRRRTIIKGKTSSLQKGFPYLKLGLLFSPHASSEDLQPAVGGSATEMISGEEQHGLYTNMTLEQLSEIMLPKAIDCLRRNAGATAYQMLWKSRHGSAYLQVEKTTVRKLLRRQEEKVERRTYVVTEFLSLWAAHAPARLQGSIMDWIQKEKEMQLAI